MTIPKDARLAAILGDRPFMVDYPAMIGQAMGGREFFAEIEAQFIHRVGRALGLAWVVPVCNRGVTHIRVTNKNQTSKYKIEFNKLNDGNEVSYTTVHVEDNLSLSQLREVYDRETINAD